MLFYVLTPNFLPISGKQLLCNPTQFPSVFDLRYDWLIFHMYGDWLNSHFFSTLNTGYGFRYCSLWRFAVSLLFRSRFSVLGKNKIEFSGLLFDAVWFFSFFFFSKVSASTTSTAYTLSLVLLAVFYYYL